MQLLSTMSTIYNRITLLMSTIYIYNRKKLHILKNVLKIITTSACQQWSTTTWPWNFKWKKMYAQINKKKMKKENACQSVKNCSIDHPLPNELAWQVLILIPCAWVEFALQFMCLLLRFAFSQSHHHFSSSSYEWAVPVMSPRKLKRKRENSAYT